MRLLLSPPDSNTHVFGPARQADLAQKQQRVHSEAQRLQNLVCCVAQDAGAQHLQRQHAEQRRHGHDGARGVARGVDARRPRAGGGGRGGARSRGRRRARRPRV
jgi:hypothetical protein